MKAFAEDVTSPETVNELEFVSSVVDIPELNVGNCVHVLALDRDIPVGKLAIQDASIELVGKLIAPDETVKPLLNVGDVRLPLIISLNSPLLLYHVGPLETFIPPVKV